MVSFSVEVENQYIGVSDILNRLSIGYRLGKLMSFPYIHQPFICRRSIPDSFLKTIEKKVLSSNEDDVFFVAQTFGLDSPDVNSSQLRTQETVNTVDIAMLLQRDDVTSINALKQEIECCQETSAAEHLNFLITDEIYEPKVRVKTQHLLGEGSLAADAADWSDREFKSFTWHRYWKKQRKTPTVDLFSKDKINVLVHIRCGDRAWLELKKKSILVHADQFLLLDRREANSSDWRTYIPERLIKTGCFTGKPVEVKTVKLILDRMVEEYGEDAFSFTVISDGYQRTIKEVIRGILTGRLRLSWAEKIQAAKAIINLQRSLMKLRRLPNTSLIIGENSKENFVQSVHAMACADVIIKTTGGFSNIHRLLKKPDSRKVCFDATQIDEQELNNFLENLGCLKTVNHKAYS
ncbi:MAG: hypothetical protein F6K00_08515 [Leptolyngbya sp. SIOISBB]|nr:hypothetical protein [Leptolyngbya sp. SIOISBB]